jgi:chromosome segregation ATPase
VRSVKLNEDTHHHDIGVPAITPDLHEPPATETISRLSNSAQERLATSIAELTALREQIAAEKIPMAQELSALEERVSQLRPEYDKITRLVDSGSLEIATIKAQTKARQDELTYIGTLLDEYARTFESDQRKRLQCAASDRVRQAGHGEHVSN